MSAAAGPLRSHKQVDRQPSIQRSCRFCTRTFTKADHLYRHTRSHTKERPFRCDDCGKNYSRHDTLLRHRRVHKDTTTRQDAPCLDDRVSRSDPCENDEPAAMNFDYLQSARDSMSRANAPPTAFEPPQLDSNLDHAMSLNANSGVDVTYAQSVIHDQSISQLSQNPSGVDFEFSPPVMGSWAMHQEPFGSWQISDDFDLEAFNASLLLPNILEQTAWQSPQVMDREIVRTVPAQGSHLLTASAMDEIQCLWITKTVDNSWKNDGNASYSVGPSRPMTPTINQSSPTTVDDSYRNALSSRLRPRWKDLALPSTEFLNSALRLFFTKFNPIFPILHQPTFHASNHNSLLLLSMCSIGSLFMGSSAATIHGSRIFERLNKVILASWENILSKNTPERLCLVQAALIGQTFAYLSGDPKYLATVEVFHGTVIAFARRCGLFNTNHNLPPTDNRTSQELEQMWKEWARSEEMIRTVLGLYIHDAQFASTFHHDPTLRHNAIRITAASTNDLFAATTASQWASLVRKLSSAAPKLNTHLHMVQPQHPCNRPLAGELACSGSRFSCYMLLHGIGAAVQESNAAGPLTSADRAKFTDALICWYHAYEKSRPVTESDPFCLMVLWHEIFMQLLADFDKLERAIGRDGPDEAADSMQYACVWSSSIEAQRCVIHGSFIYRQIGSMRIDAEPALHVPRSIFLAALAWYCYIHFEQGERESSQNPQVSTDILEVPLFNINPFQHPIETSVLKKWKPTLTDSSPLGGLVDMLLRIGHWGISYRLARILQLLVDRDEDQPSGGA